MSLLDGTAHDWHLPTHTAAGWQNCVLLHVGYSSESSDALLVVGFFICVYYSGSNTLTEQHIVYVKDGHSLQVWTVTANAQASLICILSNSQEGVLFCYPHLIVQCIWSAVKNFQAPLPDLFVLATFLLFCWFFTYLSHLHVSEQTHFNIRPR